MIRKSNPSENPAPSHHSITDHPGIVDVVPRDSGGKVEIAFDPARLSESDIRNIALEHIQPDASLQRFALRLDGQACEAAAAKLERRIENVPGVRRATATYIGRVLCLTFDKSVASEASVLAGARAAGADVRPLESRRAAKPTLWQRAKSGDLNEEISCAVGLVFLIASFIVERAVARHGLADWLYLGAYIFCGQYGVRSAIASLREKTLDVDVLMVLAALGAAAVGSPFEGALLLFLFSFSNVLQRHALERTQNAIESLLTLRPETALRKTGATAESVPVDSLQVGDVVIVRPGELIPIDGDVVEGSSNIDESSLTGESIPVPKTAGSPVFGGTLNQSGAIEIRVNHRAEDSTLARMVRLVAEAQAEKSNTQRFLEKAEQGYAAGVIAFTALVLLVPWLLWHEAFASSFYRAMTVMVVASPCALVISTPATVLSAIGGAARRGVLIKGGAHLETATRVDIVCLDKTGTLTVGKPTVTDIVTAGGSHLALTAPLPASGEQLLATCASLEAKSEHPLATAVVQAAQKAGLTLSPALDFQSSPGRGADALIDGVRYVVGSERLFAESSASGMDALRAASLELQASGKSCIWLGRRLADDTLAVEAIFGLADTLRPEGREIVRKLHALGVRKVVMLTGDQQPVAAAIAKEAGIDEFHAALLPADKVAAIRRLKNEGTVMMVGDGVNDAPALATAHLGVAMGAAGTDIAMETADIVLMGDRLDNIPLLVGIARHSRRVLIQNLTFASGVILVLLAASLGFALPLPLGVVGHEGSTVLVCLNGLRLLVYKGKS
jgi:Cd2+/Zn2+-exporting ATPase